MLCSDCKTGNKPGYKFCRSCGKPAVTSPRQSAASPPVSTSPRQSTADRAVAMSRASVSTGGSDSEAEKKAAARSKIAAAAAASKKPATPAAAVPAAAPGGEEVACPSCKTPNKVSSLCVVVWCGVVTVWQPAYKFCRKCGTPNGGGPAPSAKAAASKSSTALSRTSVTQKMEKPEVQCGDCKSDNPSGYKVR